MQKKYSKCGKNSTRYRIVISETFLEEMQSVCNYFENELNSIYASKKIKDRAIRLISNLSNSPKIYIKLDKKDKNGRHFRRIVLNNFIILYTIIEEDSIIYISHIFYGRMDYFNSSFI